MLQVATLIVPSFMECSAFDPAPHPISRKLIAILQSPDPPERCFPFAHEKSPLDLTYHQRIVMLLPSSWLRWGSSWLKSWVAQIAGSPAMRWNVKTEDGSGEKMAKLDGHYRREKRANWLAFVVLNDAVIGSGWNPLPFAKRRILNILFPSGENSILGP